jgi:hypothetical protein
MLRIFDEAQFREAIVHIAQHSADDRYFGQVKLAKILYFADFNAYRRVGQSITGAEYYKLPEGPAPRELLKEIDALVRDGSLVLEPGEAFIYVQHRILAKRDPQPGVLSEMTIAILNEVVEALRGKTAREVIELSRQQMGYKLVKDLATIPYETAWFSNEPLTQEEVEIGSVVARYHESA